MKDRETLLFIGKCLSLSLYPEKADEVFQIIHSGHVDWEKVVWISTGQFVFPALYIRLKQAGLLKELPSDLVEYMEEFTSENRQRNQKIIDQAHELTVFLNRHGITPVFLKGTAHLLEGLYEDIAERMVGDIDFLVDEKEMVRAAELLISTGYQPIEKYHPFFLKLYKHYPRLTNEKCIAAVEVHNQIIIYPYYKSFDQDQLKKQCVKLDIPGLAEVLDKKHQIIYNILNVQINDKGFYYAGIFLRQGYDLLLLSQKENVLSIVEDFGKFFHRLNANLALTNLLFDHPLSISYSDNWQARLFIFRVNLDVNHPLWSRISNLLLYVLFRLTVYFNLILSSFFNKDIRASVLNRVFNPKWYLTHIRSFKSIK